MNANFREDVVATKKGKETPKKSKREILDSIASGESQPVGEPGESENERNIKENFSREHQIDAEVSDLNMSGGHSVSRDDVEEAFGRENQGDRSDRTER
jgi:hypothetical protein